MKLLVLVALALPLCAQPENPAHSQHGPSLANQTTVKTYRLQIIRNHELGRPWFEADPPRVEDVLTRLHRGDGLRITNVLLRRTWNFTYKELRAWYLKNPDVPIGVR